MNQLNGSKENPQFEKSSDFFQHNNNHTNQDNQEQIDHDELNKCVIPIFTKETPDYHNKNFNLEPTNWYTYFNPDGSIVGCMVRWMIPQKDGTIKKEIRPYVHINNKWKSTGFPNPCPLYNLTEILARPEAIVLTSEGEKAADASKSLFPNCVATTSVHGSQSPHKTDWSPVKGKDVIISVDFDSAGIDYAKKVAEFCRRAGAQRVRYLFPEIFHVLRIHYFEKKIREREGVSPRLDIENIFHQTKREESHVQTFNKNTGQDAAFALAATALTDYDDRDNSPFDCERVPKKGYDLADALEEGWTDRLVKCVIDEAGDGIFPSIMINQISKEIPKGYELKPDGVFLKAKDNGYDTKICGYLVVTHKIATGRNNKASRLLELIDTSRQHKKIIIPMSSLGGDGTELQKMLLDEGLYMYLSKDSKSQLLTYINQFNTKKTALLVNQIGWHQDRYVLPQHTYAATDSLEEVIFNTGEADPVYHQRGSSQDWRENIATPAEGNSILEFSIGSQFAAPLLALSGEDNFIINLFGKSTTGKSTALHAACSVTGKFMKNGDCNKLPSWRGTANGTEASARESNDSCMVLDELHQATADEIGEVVYLLCNGVTKTRAYKNASKSPNVSTFSLIGLSSGEYTLADKINDSGSYKKKQHTGGQSVRFIDISVDLIGTHGIFQTLNGHKNGAEFSKYLKAASKKYCGTIFHDWMTYVVNNQESVLKRLAEYKADWMERTPVESTVDAQVERVRDKLALVAAVLRIAIDENFLPWEGIRYYQCAKDFFEAWMDHRGGTASHEYMAVDARLEAFKTVHISRFEKSPKGEYEKTPNRAGFQINQEKTTTDDQKVELYMFNHVFKDEILRGANERSTIKKLIQDGRIIPHSDRYTTHTMRFNGEEPVRFYKLG